MKERNLIFWMKRVEEDTCDVCLVIGRAICFFFGRGQVKLYP